MQKTIYSNIITEFQTNNYNTLIQGCNCQIKMGKGLAKTISQTYPEVYKADINFHLPKGQPRLGHYSQATTKDGLIINLYSQLYYGTDRPQVNYKAIENALKELKNNLDPNTSKIIYPMLGAGLGGGDWNIISNIFIEQLEGFDHTLCIFKK